MPGVVDQNVKTAGFGYRLERSAARYVGVDSG
jgi:hypothetical protein